MSDLLKTIPTFSSLALLTENYNFVKKRKKKVSDFVKAGSTNIVGSALIKAQAENI